MLGLLFPKSSIGADPSLGKQLEVLVPQAAGVTEVEVTDIKEVDSRPSDGPLP